MRSVLHRLLLLTGIALMTPDAVAARTQRAIEYERRELVIPMRDGVRLTAVALTPTRITRALPIILIRTPFGAAREFRTAQLPLALRELGEDGYIFVTQDIRGRSGSQGTFVTMRPLAGRGGSASVDESTDAWDTIDWLVRSLPDNNGRVGVMGVSYRGWLAGMAAINPHPALRAISPQGAMSDVWLGDDFFHQGAFRQTQAVLYSAYIEGSGALPIPDHDQYQFYLRMGTLRAIAAATGIDTLPSWRTFRAHPAYDEFWRSRALQNLLTRPTVPTLTVGGWWDEEDILGPQIGYRTLEQHDGPGWNRLVMGPWWHGSWARGAGDSLGPVALGSRTADHFRAQIQRPWFAHYLHGIGSASFPEVWAFETGGNAWHTFDSWPPRNAIPRKLYLRDHGVLAFEAPSGHSARAFDAYRSDPSKPVPHTPRPDDGSTGSNWLQVDQRFVDGRPDVLTWVSAPLEEDVTIAGDVTAHLFASTTGSDADWVVKLIDVYPESVAGSPAMGGYQLIVNADIMRGRYWKGFGSATAIPSNTVVRYTVDLHQQLYRFLKGHRIMVQIQSTWFPLYDRNPQHFVPNIFDAIAGDYRAAEHRIWRSARFPSHVAVSVMP